MMNLKWIFIASLGVSGVTPNAFAVSTTPGVSPKGQLECTLYSTAVVNHHSAESVLLVNQKSEPFELGFNSMDVKFPAPNDGVSVRFSQSLSGWPETGTELKPYLQSYFVRNGLPEKNKKDVNFDIGSGAPLGTIGLRDTLEVGDESILTYQCMIHIVK